MAPDSVPDPEAYPDLALDLVPQLWGTGCKANIANTYTNSLSRELKKYVISV